MPGASSRNAAARISSGDGVRLLVTRPDPDGAETAAALRALGHEVLRQPLLRIEPVANAELGSGPWGAVVMTSANAAVAIASHPCRDRLIRLPAFVVGRRTAAAARAAGFAEVRSADGDVAGLAAVVAGAMSDPTLPVLYLAGEDRVGDLEGRLAAQGLSVRTAVVYRAVMEARLDAAICAALAQGRIDGVLHYSRRSAEAFVAAAEAAGLSAAARRCRHLCISPAVAATLTAAGAKQVVAAERPNQQSLFDRLAGSLG